MRGGVIRRGDPEGHTQSESSVRWFPLSVTFFGTQKTGVGLS